MYRKLLVILVLFTIPGLIFAQTQDTLQEKGNFRSDSSMMVSSNYKPKVTAFIIPAVFIGYGVVSLT
ncbi:hypothetical protein [Pedobacter panaciterrae]